MACQARRALRLAEALCALALAGGCGKKVAPTPPAPNLRHYAFRAIGGVSMGGMGASFIGTSHPELFDAIGALGGPMDFAYLLHFMESSYFGGFCTLPELQALLQSDPTGKILNDPLSLGCMGPPPPQVLPYEHTEDFNHWRYTDNGGNFDRDRYLDLFEDLTEAFGNPLSYNPESSFFPPGVTAEIWARGADLCVHPFIIRGTKSGGLAPVYNAEYNPKGESDAILFCDGQRPIWYCADDPSQEVDWCQATGNQVSFPQTFCAAKGGAVLAGKHGPNQALDAQLAGSHSPCFNSTRPMAVALAIDLNGNGQRDLGEPIVINSHERFQDEGTDGCPDPLEDGHGGCVSDPATSPYAHGVADPNGDDYDFAANPLGTENDWRWERGEHFDDFGLDGVAGTHDFGEGNGIFDVEPAYQHYFAVDPRTNLRSRWPGLGVDGVHVPQLRRVDYLIDGGVRDVFNFGVSGAQLFGLLRALLPAADTLQLEDFRGWPSANAPFHDDTFDAAQVDWSKLPRDLFTFYGHLDATPAEILSGDGDHVGTVAQAIDRFSAVYGWLSRRWAPFPDVEVGSNPQAFGDRSAIVSYPSKALGTDRDFGIVLPPGYNSPENANARYPVVYILHGYGGDPPGMMGTDFLFDGDMTTGSLRKMIVVFPSGLCCSSNSQTGELGCTELLPDGLPRGPEWQLECNSGTFYVDSQGGPSRPPRAYGQSFLELVDYVDATYRTLAAQGGQDVPLPKP